MNVGNSQMSTQLTNLTADNLVSDQFDILSIVFTTVNLFILSLCLHCALYVSGYIDFHVFIVVDLLSASLTGRVMLGTEDKVTRAGEDVSSRS